MIKPCGPGHSHASVFYTDPQPTNSLKLERRGSYSYRPYSRSSSAMYAGKQRHHSRLGVVLPVPIIASLLRPPKTKRREIARFTYERPHLYAGARGDP